MTPRASWKGFLTIGALSCGVALHAATSTSERISLHMVSRKTGHRLRRHYVDEETGHPVEREDQVKGYAVTKDDFVILTPEEVASVVPQGEKAICVTTFVPCDSIDTAYLDRPYFLAPADAASAEAFALIAAGLEEREVAALGEVVLFRRVRKLLIHPGLEHGALVAETLSFDYEVRPAEEAFADVPDVTVTDEMLSLAAHIIRSKAGTFDPTAYADRYEAALAAMVRAKVEGKPLPRRAAAREQKVVDLMEALRASAGQAEGGKASAPRKARRGKAPAGKAAPARRSARKAG